MPTIEFNASGAEYERQESANAVLQRQATIDGAPEIELQG